MRCLVGKLEAYRTCSDSFGITCPAFAFCDLNQRFFLNIRVLLCRFDRCLLVIQVCRLGPIGLRFARFVINSNAV